MDKLVDIDNFIAVYDNYITPEECNKAIQLYENENKLKKTLNRIGFEKASILKKQDQQYFANGSNVDVWWESLKSMMINFDLAFKHYSTTTGAGDAYAVPFHLTELKISIVTGKHLH